jgi:hypothetical protein
MPAVVVPSNNREPSALHIARGWRVRPCPKCAAVPGESCRTPSGREASRIDDARLRPARHELFSHDDVWDELGRRGATIATVPFNGRAGRGGTVERIVLSRVQGDELIDVERWTARDELDYGREAPIWDRFASVAGQPSRGEVARLSSASVGSPGPIARTSALRDPRPQTSTIPCRLSRAAGCGTRTGRRSPDGHGERRRTAAANVATR